MKNILPYRHEMLLAVLLVGGGCGKQDQLPSPSTATDQEAKLTNFVSAESTEPEKRQFAEGVLKPSLEQIQAGPWSYPELEDRYRLLCDVILKRHSLPYKVSISINLTKEQGPKIASAFVATNGEPTVVLFVPWLLQAWHQSDPRDSAEQKHGKYRLFLELTLLHELDHLAGADIWYLKNPMFEHGQEVRIQEEVRAWAETTEYTLLPIIERRNPLLPRQFVDYYQAWIFASRNKDNPHWIAFIKTQYP